MVDWGRGGVGFAENGNVPKRYMLSNELVPKVKLARRNFLRHIVSAFLFSKPTDFSFPSFQASLFNQLKKIIHRVIFDNEPKNKKSKNMKIQRSTSCQGSICYFVPRLKFLHTTLFNLLTTPIFACVRAIFHRRYSNRWHSKNCC